MQILGLGFWRILGISCLSASLAIVCWLSNFLFDQLDDLIDQVKFVSKSIKKIDKFSCCQISHLVCSMSDARCRLVCSSNEVKFVKKWRKIIKMLVLDPTPSTINLFCRASVNNWFHCSTCDLYMIFFQIIQKYKINTILLETIFKLLRARLNKLPCANCYYFISCTVWWH